MRYNQISDFQKIRAKMKQQYKQSQRCCKMNYEHLQILFKLLLVCHNSKRIELVIHLHLILEKATLYNLQNQWHLQTIIYKNYAQYFQIVYSIFQNFKITSPLVSNSYFPFYDLLDHQKISIFGTSLILNPPSSREDLINKY